ncbi:MAG: hypothetical protein ABJC10_08360 [Acidobacteriota bacterium]
MEYLLKICLIFGEWIEDKRGSWRAQLEAEKKTILTFLSQGAVGGMVGYFCLIVLASSQAHGYAVFYFVLLPVFLAFGAVWGAAAGLFVWMPGALLKRRIGFVGRSGSAIGGMSLLSGAVFYLLGVTASFGMYPWLIVYVCAMYLPIVLLTGSGIRPGRLLVFGAGGRIARRRFRHWLIIPPGFLLRAASIFGMLEALLPLAVWISVRMSPGSDVSGRDGLPAIVLAITYFSTSTYFSFKTPRKTFLLALAIALNVPAVFLMMTEKQFGTADADFLAYSYFGFICLWTVYTFGCLIAPVAASRAIRLVNGTFILRKSQNATVMVQL